VQAIAVFLPAVADADERIHIRDEDVLGPRVMRWLKVTQSLRTQRFHYVNSGGAPGRQH
jgi:hypothetical protein